MGRPSWLPRWALNTIKCPSKREEEEGVTQRGRATAEAHRPTTPPLKTAVASTDGVRGARSWERRGGGVAADAAAWASGLQHRETLFLLFPDTVCGGLFQPPQDDQRGEA